MCGESHIVTTGKLTKSLPIVHTINAYAEAEISLIKLYGI